MATVTDRPLTPPTGAVVVPAGMSAASASTPEPGTDDAYHIYDSNPVPWWIAVLWLAFFAFAFVYLITNLLA